MSGLDTENYTRRSKRLSRSNKPRCPLGDVTSLHNINPAPNHLRKLQKTSVDPPTRIQKTSVEPPTRMRVASDHPRENPPPPREIPQESFAWGHEQHMETKQQKSREVQPMSCGSDNEEQSSDSSPRQPPSWFQRLPELTRSTLQARLLEAEAGCRIDRDFIIRDCCDKFQLAKDSVEDLLEWVASQDRVSSLSSALKQAKVCESSPGNIYADEIYTNLLLRESRFGIVPDYMDTIQRDISHNMRTILVDWLVEVAEEYKLTCQTLFLTVNYIDRALGLMPVNKSKLQLLGITSMLVAAKYEEIYPPSIDDFIYISDNTYSRKDVLGMETVLLTALQFNLTAPTPWEFTRRFCSAANIEDRPRFLAHYIAELCLKYPCYLKYRPSLLAASALFLALYTLYLPPWPQDLVKISGFTLDTLRDCVRDLYLVYRKSVVDGQGLKATREKFRHTKWANVASVPLRPIEDLAPLSGPIFF